VLYNGFTDSRNPTLLLRMKHTYIGWQSYRHTDHVRRRFRHYQS